MSTSLLYHGFGLVDQEYLKTEYKNGNVIFHIQTKDGKHRCSNCGSRHVIKKGFTERLFRTYGLNSALFADNKFHHIEEMIGNPFYQFKPFMGFSKNKNLIIILPKLNGS